MADLPAFRKPDRYKLSSYLSYNFRLPSRYDTCLWLRNASLLDRAVVSELLPGISTFRILDVGCATGRLLEHLARAGATQLFGVDLAPQILEVAKRRLSSLDPPVDLRSADAEDILPWRNESFDAVTLTGVLHHFFRPRDALAEIRRVLRPEGRLLVIDPCFFPPLRQMINAALRVAPHDGDYHFYSTSQAADLLSDTGFKVRQVQFTPVRGTFFLIGEKPVSVGDDISP